MKERRKKERRRWGRKVTYPFIDSEGVLVTKNRRRKIDRREVTEEDPVDSAIDENEIAPLAAAKSDQSAPEPKANTSIDISESRVMELEDALNDENEPASNIMASIQELESEILEATNVESKSSARLEVISKKNSPEEKASTDEVKADAPEVEKAEVATEKEDPAESDINNEPEEKSKVVQIKDEASSDELPELDATIDEPVNGKELDVTVELFVKGKKHILDGEKDSYQLGRDPSCDIVIQSKYVSRAHAKIIRKDGKFLLEDNSYNGTYIEFNNGQKIHVSKDEQTLIADGSMSMGKPVDDDSRSVIDFKINQ